MKKYLKMLPIMFYPYAYIIPLVIMILSADTEAFEKILFGVLIYGIVLHALVIFIAIYNSVVTAKGKYNLVSGSKINLITKGVQIPAYIFHFCLGILGLLMSVWGIGIIIFVVVVDALTIFISGISAIGVGALMNKTKALDSSLCVLCIIGSFIYCVDVVISVIYYLISKMKKNNNKQVEFNN